MFALQTFLVFDQERGATDESVTVELAVASFLFAESHRCRVPVLRVHEPISCLA